MENEKEIGRLVRVLRQITTAEKFAAFLNKEEDLTEFNMQQFNRVLSRLKELEPAIEKLFVELNDDTPPRVIKLAARELADYFDEDFKSNEHRRHFGHCRRKRIFVGFGPMFDWRCR